MRKNTKTAMPLGIMYKGTEKCDRQANKILIASAKRKKTVDSTFILAELRLAGLLTPIAKNNGKPMNRKLPIAISHSFSLRQKE